MSQQDTVLLIDDDSDLIHGVSLRLRAAGYHSLTAPDGSQGLAVARTAQPAAIVLDVRMPRMNGLEVLRILRRDQRTRDIPVVMLSCSLDDQKAAFEAGARYFVTKPYDPTTLVTAIQRAIGESCHV